ncbi:MmyB family transcriptional regulator [Streptomyces buecherae]|uniref:MmyB family transcriptional regulator n=1 Tax=Streptomyces buecherae TaxID=2763006 RepID=UPI0027E2A05B|nr:hypothetical protein [Streptomyces buecherae]
MTALGTRQRISWPLPTCRLLPRALTRRKSCDVSTPWPTARRPPGQCGAGSRVGCDLDSGLLSQSCDVRSLLMPARWPASPVSVPSTTPVLNRAVLAPPLSGSHRIPGPQLPIRPRGARALCRPPRAPHPVSPFLHGAPASPPRPAPHTPHPGPRPAFILGRCTDVLAAHRLARDVLTGFDTPSAPQRNLARYYLLDPEARCRVVDWE